MVRKGGRYTGLPHGFGLLRALTIGGWLWAVAAGHAGAAPSESQGFTVVDYFEVRQVVELALSSDGKCLAYVTERRSLDENTVERKVQLRSPPDATESTTPAALADARSLAWIPRTCELAFLSSRAGSSQVYSFDLGTGELRQRTKAKDPVESFLFAPDGRSLAYLTREVTRPGASLYRRFRDEKTGILIDPATTSSHDFVNPHWHGMDKRETPVLWAAAPGKPAVRVPVPGDPSGDDNAYHWSSEGRWLSVTYIAAELPAARLRDERTSLGVFDRGTGDFRVVADAKPREGERPGRSFAGGEWVPGERRILVRRVEETDPWVSWAQPDWTVADAFGELPQSADAWQTVEVYPRRLRFTPVHDSEILLENTANGVHSLFVLTPEGLRRSGIVAGLEGSNSLFRFSADFGVVAFVNESLTRPPEIYLRRRDAPAQQASDLNGEVARKIRYRSREVSWQGADGVTIKGWLLEPPQGVARRPWPLVTHVHGGPAFPFPDAFAPYFDYWPYPFEVLAERGIAVFMPNYRGTHTYGRAVAEAQNDEALEDIIAGVQALVEAGDANPVRLGVSGHSHGAIVGPQVMAEEKSFRAASFAEGSANSVVMYELMSEQANLEIHDRILGVSLYESPQRYIDDSPDLHFAGVPTATLFEAGAYTAAIHMLGFPKAARRAGMPTEFVIYPQTQHNLSLPSLQKEAAVRNLDWFRFWLTGREEPVPARQERYERWRALRGTAKLPGKFGSGAPAHGRVRHSQLDRKSVV